MWQCRRLSGCCHIAGGYNEGFRAKFRPVHFNLKDDKNPDFRGKVLRGELQPVDLLRMEPKDMASEVMLHQDPVMIYPLASFCHTATLRDMLNNELAAPAAMACMSRPCGTPAHRGFCGKMVR